jgi:hypothetical protein
MSSAAPPLLDSQTHYFRIGRVRWRGAFGFRITDRAAFRAAPLTPRERLLARGMALAHRVTGHSPIDSDVWARPEDQRHIDGVLTCAWARATETIHKLDG